MCGDCRHDLEAFGLVVEASEARTCVELVEPTAIEAKDIACVVSVWFGMISLQGDLAMTI